MAVAQVIWKEGKKEGRKRGPEGSHSRKHWQILLIFSEEMIFKCYSIPYCDNCGLTSVVWDLFNESLLWSLISLFESL